jgi:hypothetical protein
MVVAPRFYWHLVETSWVLGIVRAFEASLHDGGATCRLVAEEDVAVVADPGDDPVVFQTAEVAVPGGGTLRYFIVADYWKSLFR